MKQSNSDKEKLELEQSDELGMEQRREFIKKYGKLAAITPVALSLAMHSKKALASGCTTNCGDGGPF